MKQGNIKWFNSLKGYGFIIDEDGKDHFAHYSHFNNNEDGSITRSHRTLDGCAVTFDVEVTGEKSQAVNITLI